MRIHEILTEGYSESELISISRAIVQDCSPFLSMIDNKPLTYGLFRGEDTSDESLIVTRRCPKNRRPRDSAIENHKVTDDWFFKNTGIRFRSNAFFAIGDADIASSFGNVYRIFPKGKFTFCWSPDVKDITNEVFSNYEIDDFDTTKQFKAALINELVALEYQTTDLKEAIISDNEIMIHCQEAYLLLADESNDRLVLQYIEKAINGQLPQRPESARPAIVAKIKSKESDIRFLQLVINRKQSAINKADKAQEIVNQNEYDYYKRTLPQDYQTMEIYKKELQELKNENS